jgi:glycosyltransferase involved in cell wall biosynthesis
VGPPTVSVVMPVYNGERFVEEAVSSILSQTFADFELIAVDDGSNDSTPRILERLADRDSRLRVLPGEHRGVVAAVLRGSRDARGRFIARMDADDISLPDRFERQLDVLDARPDLGAVGTWLWYIEEDGSARGEWRTPTGSALVAWSLQFGTALANPTVMLRRELYESVGGDRQQYRYAHDYDLWLRLARKSCLDNLPEHLLIRRVHAESDSALNRDRQEEQVRRLALTSLQEQFDLKDAARGIEAIRWVITRPEDADEDLLLRAADFTERLFRRYSTMVPLTRVEERVIRIDAARRIGEIAHLARARDRGLSRRLSFRSLRLRWGRLGA